MNSGTSTNKPRSSWSWLIPVALAAIPLMLIASLFAAPLVEIHKADSGFRRAQATIDSGALRLWAAGAIQKYSETNGSASEIPSSEIPTIMKNLYPSPAHAWVNSKTADREACVMIMWGGGFFHWGFDIGPTNYLPIANPEYPKFKLAPGIYYQRDAGWGLL